MAGLFPFRGRRSIASASAPSVALAVASFSRLPSPPFEDEENAGKRAKKIKLLPTTPVSVKVGREYDFITTGVIARIRVEKIWQDPEGNTYVVVSQGSNQGRLTHAIHISEFNQRVLAGGLPEVTI